MSDRHDSRRPKADRRSMLVAVGTTLAGLGALSTVQGVNAQEDEWPIGGPEDGAEADEWDETVPDDYDAVQTVTDDTGSIEIAIPSAWSDVDGTPVEIGPSLWAAPDLAGFATTWDVPGLEVYTTTQLGSDLEPVLDLYLEELGFADDCTQTQRTLFRTDGYAFLTQPLYQCAGTETMFLAMAGAPIDEPENGPPTDEPPEDEMPGPGPGPEDEMPGPGPGPEDEMPGPGPGPGPGDDILTDAPYIIIFGAQIVTEQDWDAVMEARGSLATRSPDARDA